MVAAGAKVEASGSGNAFFFADATGPSDVTMGCVAAALVPGPSEVTIWLVETVLERGPFDVTILFLTVVLEATPLGVVVWLVATA